MKLLVVDHNAVHPGYRTLYQKIAELGGVELRLVVPNKWFDTYRLVTFVPPQAPAHFEIFGSDVLFPTRTHRMIYLSLRKHFRSFRPDVVYVNAEPENFQTFESSLLADSKTKLVFSSWRNVDHSIEGYPYRFSLLHRTIEHRTFGRFNHGVVFSQAAKSIFERLGFHSTTFIPPSVDRILTRPFSSMVI